jgi:cytochrome c553
MPLARLTAVLLVASAATLHSAEPTGTPEFFEKKIRPILAEHCLRCHGDLKGKEPKGGLRLDSREAALKGGDNGPAFVPGQSDKSRLLEAVRYQNADLQMPPKGKLSDMAIADLVAWVKAGAAWSGEAAGPKASAGGFDLAKRKASHWAWQPIKPTELPAVRDPSWPNRAVDRFILTKLEEKGIRPAAQAERRVWLRRVWFDLVGLPPTPDALAAYLGDTSPDAERKVVDSLLASPHFGERWGRHWLDLVRYAETHGHEFDAVIPNAYQYRDYVIRALNADVPYDRFVQEHVAGDMLPDPRLHPTQGFNESILGTGFWFLGEEVHSPVDIRQDEADRFDNRIDVLTKTFCALTVSCARCHDHKFDAISTKDYYALFGLIEGAGYRQVRFDTIEPNRKVATELDELADRAGRDLATILKRDAKAIVLTELRKTTAGKLALPPGSDTVIDYAACRPGQWLPDDASFNTRPRRVGDLLVEHGKVRFAEIAAATYDPVWDALNVPPGTESEYGALGKHIRAGRSIRTPEFKVAGKLHYLVRGSGTAYAAVDEHTLIAGPLHGSLVIEFPDSSGFRWVTQDLTPYQGQLCHVEFTVGKDSDFAVAMVVQGPTPPPVPAVDEDAHRANELLAHGDGNIKMMTDEYLATRRMIAKNIRPMSRLAPAIWEGTGVDENVFVRGSPKGPGERVPRRFLEALGGSGPITSGPGSGRLELARTMTDPAKNPFIARVAVNRIWHHLFGRGIVASVDNFGVLGEAPTHPELLDYLAEHFVRDGWSTKRLIRELVLSSSYRMASFADAAADQADPQNLLLHRMRLRRLEGEVIRDSMLAVSGRLDPTEFGPSVPVHLTPFLEGRGRPGKSGPLDGAGRRSVYQSVYRNFLNPFLLAFDTPIPFSTVGRRQVSNVPAQSLILMNDPFVHEQAAVWARAVTARPGTTDERVRSMYLAAFGRPPTADESAACADFVQQQAGRYATAANDVKPWSDLAHTLFNAKDFIYLE